MQWLTWQIIVASKYFFLISPQKLRCKYSFDAPLCGTSNEYPQYMFFLCKNRKKWLFVFEILVYLELYILCKRVYIIHYYCPCARVIWWLIRPTQVILPESFHEGNINCRMRTNRHITHVQGQDLLYYTEFWRPLKGSMFHFLLKIIGHVPLIP